MLKTCEKQETHFWQGGRAALESPHRPALTAGGAAAQARTGQAGATTAFHSPSPRALTAEKLTVCLLMRSVLLNLLNLNPYWDKRGHTNIYMVIIRIICGKFEKV